MKQKSGLTYIQPFDGLRAFAIMLVLIWHFFTVLIPDPSENWVFSKLKFLTWWTWSGVDLFFILSGFLIGRILLTYRDSPKYFSTFYIRRVLRIFPAYYLVLAVFVVVISTNLGAYVPWLTMHPFPVYSYALFIQNFYISVYGYGPHWMAPTWSLAVEEQFYLILPMVIRFLPPRWLWWFLVAGVVAAPLVRFAASDISAYVLLPGRVDALFAGVLLGWVHLKGGFQKGKVSAWMPIAVLVISFLLMYLYSKMTHAPQGDPGLHTIMVVMYAALVMLVLAFEDHPITRRMLCNPIVIWVGRLSYTLYLVHQVFNGIAHQVFRHSIPTMRSGADVLTAIAGIAGAIAMAWVLHRFVEQPVLKKARRFSY